MNEPTQPLITVATAVNVGSMCPTQFKGTTEDGREVYARYRWGYLSVEIDEVQVFGERLGDLMDGCLSGRQLAEATKKVIEWPLNIWEDEM